MTKQNQPWTDEQRHDIHESVSWMAKQTRQGPDYHTIKAQRDALLEALKAAIVRAELRREGAVDVGVIRAAIKAVEENT